MKPVAYFQGVLTELRRVTWPTVPVVVRNVLAVGVGVAVATVLIGTLDYLFLKLLGLIIN